MNKTIKLLDNTTKLINNITSKTNNIISKQKEKLAYKIFNDNKYIKNYIQHFYNNFEYSFINNDGWLERFNSFDFSQIPEELKENFKDYMSLYHGLYYYQDDYIEGFTIGSFDNIYITYNDGIYADFLKKNVDLKTDSSLELFLKLEQIQAKHGIYPDIVYLDYYDNYIKDYTLPKEYTFLKTACHNKEDRLLWFINQLIEIYDNEMYHYYDNFIVEEFTPAFIKSIDNNLSIDILDVTLDDNFDLHISYDIPTKLREENPKKQGITTYHYSSYKTTIIDYTINIESWLKEELNRGYSYDDLKKNVA